MYDAVVVASGSNSVLVYKTLTVDRTGQPTFAAPVSYPVGTDPVSLTVGYFNGSPVPSLLVVNKGSNDISVIFGDMINGTWVGGTGPRLNSGGTGPISVSLEPVGGDSVPALVVTNAGSGTITALPGIGRNGVGTGFFRDNAPMILAVPAAPIGPLTADYLPTAQGIYRFEPTTMAVTQVFASSALTALSVTANGLVVAGFAGGMLGVLRDTGSGSLAVAQTFGDARLTTLSGLQAIVTPDGSTEVFASGAGTSGSVFAFTLAGIGGDPFPVTPEPGIGDNPFSFTIQQGVAIVDPTPLSQPGPTIDVDSVGSTGTFFVAVLTSTGASGQGGPGATDSPNDAFAVDVTSNITALAAVLLIGGTGSGDDTAGPDSESTAIGPLPLNDFITGIEDALDAVRKQIREREGAEGEAGPPAPEMDPMAQLMGAPEARAATNDPADARRPKLAPVGAEQSEAPLASGSAGAPEECAAILVTRAPAPRPVEVRIEPVRDDPEPRTEAPGQWHWFWLPVLLSCAWLWLDERSAAARRREREEVYSGSGSPIDTVR